MCARSDVIEKERRYITRYHEQTCGNKKIIWMVNSKFMRISSKVEILKITVDYLNLEKCLSF